MRFDIITLFPEACAAYLATSILGRAQESGRLTCRLHNVRDFATDKHRTTDDTPYGGGAGMVMKIEPIDRCLEAIKAESGIRNLESGRQKTVVLSARGHSFTQTKAQEYAQLEQLTLICGRYEGIDQRVADHLADEELSLGPFVLSGGELPALAVVDAVARLVPGVLGNPDSLAEESFNSSDSARFQIPDSRFLVEYPHYTKPEVYRGWPVPDVLLSGDHGKIKQWREEQRK